MEDDKKIIYFLSKIDRITQNLFSVVEFNKTILYNLLSDLPKEIKYRLIESLKTKIKELFDITKDI